MVKAQQAKCRFLNGFIGFRVGRHVRDHRRQFGIAIMGIAAGNTIRQAVILALMVLHQNGIQIAAVGIQCLTHHGR
ncbi:hypothetical protein D3C75_1362100 [compost metagenome]